MLKQYVYPATFENEDNGSISVYFPDLKGCYAYGETLEEATLMAKSALESWIETMLEENQELANPSPLTKVTATNGRVMLVVADAKNMKSQTRFVKKTLSLPYHLNAEAESAGINFSQTLQQALQDRLHPHR